MASLSRGRKEKCPESDGLSPSVSSFPVACESCHCFSAKRGLFDAHRVGLPINLSEENSHLRLVYRLSFQEAAAAEIKVIAREEQFG